MTPLPAEPDLLAVAERVIWFEPPAVALGDPYRFMTYLMAFGTAAEIAVVRRYVDAAGFRDALDRALPGIMDPRSWAYWNVMAGRYPPPPPPARAIPGASSESALNTRYRT